MKNDNSFNNNNNSVNIGGNNIGLEYDESRGVYKSFMGNEYKYDLSKPMDRLNYSMDMDAQMNDKLNKPLTPTVEIDESMGQYGGGLIKE